VCGAHTVLEVDSEQMTLSELFGRRVCQSIVWEVDLRTASSPGSHVCGVLYCFGGGLRTDDVLEVV
jgi:hypothetical protein